MILKINPDIVLANIFPCQYLLPKIRSYYAVWYCHEPSAYLYRTHSIRNLALGPRLLIGSVNPLLHLYDKMQIKKFDKILTNSNFTANMIREVYKVNSRVVYPGVDPEKFKPSAENKTEPNVLLSVGMLLKSKRLDLFFKAIKILKLKGYLFHVIIVGRGPN